MAFVVLLAVADLPTLEPGDVFIYRDEALQRPGHQAEHDGREQRNDALQQGPHFDGAFRVDIEESRDRLKKSVER